MKDGKEVNDAFHFQQEASESMACEVWCIGRVGTFGKCDISYRDLPIHGNRVTCWEV